MNFSWCAYYNDSRLLQFEGDKENFFKDINFSELNNFVLAKDHSNTIFDESVCLVSVQTGVIYLFGIPFFFGEHDSNRLVYYRKVKKHFTMEQGISDTEVIHYFGIQATVDGVNKKMVFGLNDTKGFFVLDND